MRDGAASETARRVAAQRLTFDRIPASYGDAVADERLGREVAGDAPARGLMTDYLRARTAFFDRVVVGCLDGGLTQVVVGAAGYDGRALRYAKPGVRWFELDHPATQTDKRRRLAELGIACGHVTFVAADFEIDDVRARLIDAGIDASAASLFLLEGVAVYLTRPTLGSLLAQIRSVAGTGSRLAISLSVSGGSPGSQNRRQAFQAGVAALGEPTRSSVAPDEVEALLTGAGWRLGESGGRGRAAGLVLAEAGET